MAEWANPYNVLATETRREYAWAGIIGRTVNVLERPEVIDALGDKGPVIKEAIEQSFCVPRVAGRLAVPTHLRPTDHFGLHPVLLTDFTPAVYGGTEWLLDDDPATQNPDNRTVQMLEEKLDHDMSRRYEQGSWSTDNNADSLAGQLVCTYQDAIGEWKVAVGRPLITMRSVLTHLTGRLTFAAIMSSQYHSSIAATKMFREASVREVSEIIGDAEAMKRVWVELAKVSYKTMYDVLSTGRTCKDLPTADEFTQQISHMDVLDAAGAVRDLVKQPERRLPRVPGRQLYATAVGAVALSQVFGEQDAPVTDDEKSAYLLANMIRARSRFR